MEKLAQQVAYTVGYFKEAFVTLFGINLKACKGVISNFRIPDQYR